MDFFEDALNVLDSDKKFNKYLNKTDHDKSLTKKTQNLSKQKQNIAYFMIWCKRRNKQISKYLADKNHMPIDSFEVKLAPIEDLKNHNGQAFFKVIIDIQ